MLTIPQAAARANLHDNTIRNAIAAGALPATKAGGQWLIEPEELDAWASARTRREDPRSRRDG
ncbi:helix-turn-helix domain-containing protein [Nocardia sp. NBC_00511]|uniref:helix-turn-helix domain-containing protein n=1 Tax=Nocardia sp. NBC_00511 TaxID=2903591 RepID=UPI003864FA28